MPIRRLATASLAALALAAPATALAQGAGDDQYQDPFGTQQGDGGSGGDSSDEAPDTTPAPASPAAEPAGASAPEEQAAEPATAQLPRTGSEPGLIALAGAGLILTGVGLRLRVTVD